MRKMLFAAICLLVIFFCACTADQPCTLVATTAPVFEFTNQLCQSTGLEVQLLMTENVSCLHDYTLQVNQMRAIQGCDTVIISGAGLEDFLLDALNGANTVIDASQSLTLAPGHDHDHHADPGHIHEQDPHIWLSVSNAQVMAQNICNGLCAQYPQYSTQFQANLAQLQSKLSALEAYGKEKLRNLSCRQLVTFHDGFSYFAEAFDLDILKAIEEESGSEASAKELIEIIQLVEKYDLPSIFTEINGSVSAAEIISAQTGVKVYSLSMAMGSENYFDAMYRNIDTIWEALQ